MTKTQLWVLMIWPDEVDDDDYHRASHCLEVRILSQLGLHWPYSMGCYCGSLPFGVGKINVSPPRYLHRSLFGTLQMSSSSSVILVLLVNDG